MLRLNKKKSLTIKRILGLVVVFSMLISQSSILSYAAACDNEGDTNSYVYYVPEDEREANLEADLNAIMASHLAENKARIPDYAEYKYEKLDTVYSTASGYAGNCPEGGVKFSTGGSFYWSETGGRDISVSLGVTYKGVTVAINLGARTGDNTGYICNVPSKTAYYRLWSKPKYKVTPTKVFGKKIGSSTFTYLYTIYPKTLFSVELLAKKVG